MRRFLLLLLGMALAALPVFAQQQAPVRVGSGIVRHYNFEASGRDYYPAGNPPTLEITFGQDPTAGTLTPDIGTCTFTINGSPSRSDDSTWPSGPSGARGKQWFFGGTNEWAECTEANGADAFDSPTNLTVCFDVRPSTFGSTRYIISKYEAAAGDFRSWSVGYLNTGSVTMSASDDGTSAAGHQTSLSVANAWTPFSRGVGCFTYKYVTDGTSQMRGYMGGIAAASTDVANGPIFDNNESLGLGATSRGASKLPGWAGHVAIWASESGDASKTLTEAECRRWIAGRWGTYNGASEGITIVNATGNYEQVLPYNEANYLQAIPPNSAAAIHPVSGLMGIQGDPAMINRAWRWGAEAWAGAGAGGCTNYPTGWTPTCTAGDGTADMAPETGNVPEGGYAIATTLTGTTSIAVPAQHCDADGIGQVLDVSVEHRCKSGTCASLVQLYEYSDANCTTFVASNTLFNMSGTTAWQTQRGRMLAATWNGATQSYRIRLTETCNGGCTSVWDALVYVSSTAGVVPSYSRCGANSDADVTCNHTYAYDATPIRGNMPHTLVWRGFSEWAAGSIASGAQYLFANGGSTANTFYCGFYNSTSYAQCIVKDATNTSWTSSSGAGLSWNADTSHTIKWWRTGDGILMASGVGSQGGYVDSTNLAAPSGAGTGVVSDWMTYFYLISLGASSTGVSSTVLSDLVFYNRVVP